MKNSEIKQLLTTRELLKDRIHMFSLLKLLVVNKKEFNNHLKEAKKNLKTVEAKLKGVEIPEKVLNQFWDEYEKLIQEK